ncbi:Zinc finger CCCH domain-containing protein 13 [Cucurbita argyrosperma subsp. argyrosperma]|nr:Zinc finger CCCH domain-containing protein 13 [Cucurbita argyrosperma subsp. argyrosperma]
MMIGRKLFKTKLCVLYQKGHCSRPSCSFAHGNAELRRFAGASSAAYDISLEMFMALVLHQLNQKERFFIGLCLLSMPNGLPVGEYNPGHGFFIIFSLFLLIFWNWHGGTTTVPYFVSHLFHVMVDRNIEKMIYGISLTAGTLPCRKGIPEGDMDLVVVNDHKRRKKDHGDSRTDYAGNLRITDRSEERDREGKISSSSRDTLEGQLNKMQADIEMAEHHRHQAEVYLDEKIQEVDSLTSRIQELESQLYNEREECRRIKSKIKKFVKAHNRYSGIQDELKRQLGDQLGSDVNKIGANEEDSSVNIVSDGEDPRYHAAGPLHHLHKDTSASKRKLHVDQDIAGNSKRADLHKGSKEAVGRLRRISRWNAHPAKSMYSKIEAVRNENNDYIPKANESRQKRGKASNSVSTADKVRSLDAGVVVPLTSMAAHAVNEEVDIELEVNNEVSDRRESTKEAASGSAPLLPPPPSPIHEINHSRYEGEDQNIDVEVVDDESAGLDDA